LVIFERARRQSLPSPRVGLFSYDMEPELRSSVYRGMEKLGLFKLRLIGGTGMSLDLLAETALIAIYRAATVAIETGATDFQLARRRPVRACR